MASGGGNAGARGDEDGEPIDDGVAPMAHGAVDVIGGEGEGTVTDRADEEIEGGLGELHLDLAYGKDEAPM